LLLSYFLSGTLSGNLGLRMRRRAADAFSDNHGCGDHTNKLHLHFIKLLLSGNVPRRLSAPSVHFCGYLNFSWPKTWQRRSWAVKQPKIHQSVGSATVRRALPGLPNMDFIGPRTRAAAGPKNYQGRAPEMFRRSSNLVLFTIYSNLLS